MVSASAPASSSRASPSSSHRRLLSCCVMTGSSLCSIRFSCSEHTIWYGMLSRGECSFPPGFFSVTCFQISLLDQLVAQPVGLAHGLRNELSARREEGIKRHHKTTNPL